MKAIIRSYDALREDLGDTPGKTAEVVTDDFKIRAGRTILIIQASVSVWTSSGVRGGNPKEIGRDLKLELSAQDCKAILNAALKAGIVEPSFAVREPKRSAPRKGKRPQ